jgi:hypothetical protein
LAPVPSWGAASLPMDSEPLASGHADSPYHPPRPAVRLHQTSPRQHRAAVSGLYSPPADSTCFPLAYFARPGEITEAFPADRIDPQFLFGCEGIFNQSEANLKAVDADIRMQWLELGIEFSRTGLGIASSEHVVFVGRRRA